MLLSLTHTHTNTHTHTHTHIQAFVKSHRKNIAKFLNEFERSQMYEVFFYERTSSSFREEASCPSLFF